MENQQLNLRFLINEDFASIAIEMIQNLGRTIIETFSDEMRFLFQDCKRELLDSIDRACGKIRFMRNYNNDFANGEDQ